VGWRRGSRGDLKRIEGGLVRRPCSPVSRGYLAYVGQEAPRRFSGYSSALKLQATPTLPASETSCGVVRCIGASNRRRGLKPDSCG